MKNMDSSEGDFALLLLAEKQRLQYLRKIGERTSKHTNVTKIIVLLFPLLYDYHLIDQSLDRSVKIPIN